MPEKVLMSQEDIRRALLRIAHEIVERNQGPQDLVFIGLRTRGHPLAQRLASSIHSFENVFIPVGALDINLYRDDIGRSRAQHILQPSSIPVDITLKKIVLVDDVLFTGRSIRAALDELTDFGRPASIQLAVLVDRGHRELPVRADYVGKNIPTSLEEEICVRLTETDGQEVVVLISPPQEGAS